MEINKNNFFKIFENNFSYEIVETPLGKAIRMSARDAFIYSNITGAGYFENPIYPFTPKGLLKLFYNAFSYKFVTGIFENITLKNTPFMLSQSRKYLFENDKYILVYEFDTEADLLKELTKDFSKVEDPYNYLIQRIETSKKGYGMEPFMEYLTSEHFKKIGYIVETQIPLAHSLGSPDFGGYGLANAIKKLTKAQLIGSGFHVIELALLRLNTINEASDKFPQSLIVGEAKTGTNIMTTQLEKYLDSNLFDYGFEIHPSKNLPSEDYFGLVTIDASYKVTVTLPKDSYKAKKVLSKEDYVEWLNNYLKFYLIANMKDDEFNTFYVTKTKNKISSQEDIIKFIINLSFEEIILEINKLLK